MAEGDVCTYRIKSRGGSPAIQLNNRTKANCDEFEMKYVEYNEYNINATETSNGTSKPKDRRRKKPRFDMPGRNATFGDAGKPQDADMGKQKAPKRRFRNGTKTQEESVQQRKTKKLKYYKLKKTQFEKENKDGQTKANITKNEDNRRPQWMKNKFQNKEDYRQGKEKNGKQYRGFGKKWSKTSKKSVVERGSSKQQRKGSSEDEESFADMGYGKMTKGEYNACGGKGTFKTFGSTGQGWDKLGVKDDNAGEDEPRTMLVTVRAKKQVKRLRQTSSAVSMANGEYL